jgi:predicted metal-dependent hydrolase
MDYVILHELLHTRIKNHSHGFWAEMDQLVGSRAKELAKRLKEYGLGLY